MANKTIYVVFGNSGEYSDFRDWPVVAYDTEDSAIGHAEKAKRRAEELKVLMDAAEWNRREALQKTNEFDPHMNMDYTGVDYSVFEIELREGRVRIIDRPSSKAGETR